MIEKESKASIIEFLLVCQQHGIETLSTDGFAARQAHLFLFFLVLFLIVLFLIILLLVVFIAILFFVVVLIVVILSGEMSKGTKRIWDGI